MAWPVFFPRHAVAFEEVLQARNRDGSAEAGSRSPATHPVINCGNQTRTH
jgi:hypothetical protein